MQPLKWDTASRTSLTDSISLFVLPDASRHPPAESFGFHLRNSDSAPPVATPHGSESSRSDGRADQQPPQPAPPVPSRNPAPEPARQASSPAEPADSASQDPAQSAGSDALPADPQDDLAQSPSSESPASDNESEGRPAHAANRDEKLSGATRRKTGFRHAQMTTSGDGEVTSSPSDTETRAATKKRVAPQSGKSKGVGKSQRNGRVPDSGQPETVAAPAMNDKLRQADITKQTGLSLDGEAAGQVSKDSAIDRSLTANEQSSTNDAVDVQSQPTTGTISADPTTLVPDSDVDRATRVGKRGNRGSQDGRGVDALAAAGSLSPAELAPETMAGLRQLDESIALGELPGGPVATESATVPSPATSASQGSTPIAPHMRFAQHLAVKPGERAARTSPLTDLEHARLVDRVARAFQAAEARGGTVTLRLHPPELGALRVELRVIEGALSARLEAETPAARTVLLDNVQMLHDRLAEQGVRIERFDVDLLDRRPSGDAPAFEQNSPHDQEARRQPSADSSGRELREPDSIRPIPRAIATGQLNVIV